jgi:hypothetical protein
MKLRFLSLLEVAGRVHRVSADRASVERKTFAEPSAMDQRWKLPANTTQRNRMHRTLKSARNPSARQMHATCDRISIARATLPIRMHHAIEFPAQEQRLPTACTVRWTSVRKDSARDPHAPCVQIACAGRAQAIRTSGRPALELRLPSVGNAWFWAGTTLLLWKLHLMFVAFIFSLTHALHAGLEARLDTTTTKAQVSPGTCLCTGYVEQI